MKKKRFSEEQIISILKENEAGIPIRELARKYGFCEQTFYRWKSKFGGMEVSDARKLKKLEEENRRLKQLIGELSLDNQALKWVIEKNA